MSDTKDVHASCGYHNLAAVECALSDTFTERSRSKRIGST